MKKYVLILFFMVSTILLHSQDNQSGISTLKNKIDYIKKEHDRTLWWNTQMGIMTMLMGAVSMTGLYAQNPVAVIAGSALTCTVGAGQIALNCMRRYQYNGDDDYEDENI